MTEGADSCCELDNFLLLEAEMRTPNGKVSCIVGVDPALVQDVSLGKDVPQF